MCERLNHRYRQIPELDTFLDDLPRLDLKQRAFGIKVCQAQTLPRDYDTYPLARMARVIPHIRLDNTSHHESFVTYFEYLRPLVHSTLFSGLLLDLFRNYRFPKEIEAEMREQSWKGEIQACEKENPGAVLDFDVWMDPQKFGEPLHKTIPANRVAHMTIHAILVRWKKEAASKIHYPRMNDKNMSWSTVRAYEYVTGEKWDFGTRGMFSQRIYQQFKEKTGVVLGGSCELRQTWTPAAVKPRSYWAMGGLAYDRSSTSQDIWNDLVNRSPSTNHISRLLPGRLLLAENQICRVYDFQCFTSEFHQQVHFLRKLAGFCADTEITYMDVSLGLVDQNMGAYIDEYVDQCAARPAVSYERRIKGRHTMSRHNHAAGLGIFGNLATCTFTHFGFELELIGDEELINTGGDDGEVNIYPDEIEEFDCFQSLIGIYQDKKMFRSDQDGCISYKRHLIQLRDKLILCPMVIWPTVPTLEYGLYRRKDPRFHYWDDDLVTLHDRLDMIGVEVLRFLVSLHWLSFNIADEELLAALSFATWIGKEVERLYTPLIPMLPQCGGDFLWPSIPKDRDELKRHPVESMVMSAYHGHARLNRRDLVDAPHFSEFRYQNQVISSNSSKRIAFLRNLGFLKVEAERVIVTGEEGYHQLLKEFDTRVPVVYQITVLTDIPRKFL